MKNLTGPDNDHGVASSDSKYKQVQASLEQLITSGAIPPGEQIPNERYLAARYGVSYMTVRRAISELVMDDLLERRSSKGTFVRLRGHDKLTTVKINLITQSYGGYLQREFIKLGKQLANEEGWQPNVVLLNADQQDPAVRALRGGGYSIVMLANVLPNSSLGLAMRTANGRAILVSQSLADWGVPSVISDAHAAVELAIGSLTEAGHKDIAYVLQVPTDTHNALKLDCWKTLMSQRYTQEQIEQRIVEVHTPLGESPIKGTYETVRQFIKNIRHASPERGQLQTTAFLSAGEEITYGILAACRDEWSPVPNRFSLVDLSVASDLLLYASPSVTCADVDLSAQIGRCADILRQMPRALQQDEMLQIVKPRLFQGKSVQPPP